MPSPQERTHQWLKENGWTYQKVEQTIHIPDPAKGPFAKRMFKRDLFGFCDVLAVRPGSLGATFLQVTAGMNNKGERQAKIDASPASRIILQAGNQIELHIWRKMGPRGARKLWKLARFQVRIHGNDLVWLDVSHEADDDDDFDTFKQSALALQSP